MASNTIILQNIEQSIAPELLEQANYYLEQQHFTKLQSFGTQLRSKAKPSESFQIFFRTEDKQTNEIKITLVLHELKQKVTPKQRDIKVIYLCSLHGKNLCTHIAASLILIKELKRMEIPKTFGCLQIMDPKQTKAFSQFSFPHYQKQILQLDEEIQKKQEMVNGSLTCQICLEIIKSPVLLPCNKHFICLKCSQLYLKQKKLENGIYLLKCPTCGVKAATTTLTSLDDLVVLTGFENIFENYNEILIKMQEKIRQQHLFLEKFDYLNKTLQFEKNSLLQNNKKIEKANKKFQQQLSSLKKISYKMQFSPQSTANTTIYQTNSK